jgi:4-amino-4-deoxy-L-arabinose transferase-like glycosyltransferase
VSMDSRSQADKHYRNLFYLFLAGITVFRLFYIQWLELAPDEAYYWTWSRHLQWAYYDHPPMVGFLIWVFSGITDTGEFGVRLGWVILGALVTLFLYRGASRMFESEKAGLLCAFLTNIILLASTGAVIVTPDGPLALCWVAAVFFVHQAVAEGKRYAWVLAGVAFGLGLLSKYTMVLFAPCILLFLLSSKETRKWLARKEPYLALILGLVIFSPVILWNAGHDWVSFRFQISHGLEVKKAAGWRYFGEYWGGQAGVVSPLMLLALIWAMVKSAQEGFRRNEKKWLLLFWTSTPILLFFGYTSLRSKVEANWPALAYFSAVVALSGLILQGWGQWGGKRKGFIRAAVIVAFLFTFLAHLQPIYAVVPIAAKKDPTSQLYGWKILAGRIGEIARSFPPGQEVFLLTPRHQLVAETMFYTKFPVYQWDAPLRINNLAPGNSPPAGSNAVFFNEQTHEFPAAMGALFESCEKVEPLVVLRNASPVRVHPMWKCSGFRGLGNKKQ